MKDGWNTNYSGQKVVRAVLGVVFVCLIFFFFFFFFFSLHIVMDSF